MQPVSTRISSPAASVRSCSVPPAWTNAQPLALEALHDEAFAAEQTDAELALERDADAHALGGGEERVLLRHQLAADVRQVDRNDLPRIGRAERDALLLAALVQEDRHEQRFAGQQALSSAHERPKKPALLGGTVAEYRLHLDAVVHVHHAAGFRDSGFVRVQLHLHELHVVAEDFVIDLIHCLIVPSMPEPIRVAFLGCGFITGVHSRHLTSLGGDITWAYASRDAAKAAAYCRRYRGSASYGDYARRD